MELDEITIWNETGIKQVVLKWNWNENNNNFNIYLDKYNRLKLNLK